MACESAQLNNVDTLPTQTEHHPSSSAPAMVADNTVPYLCSEPDSTVEIEQDVQKDGYNDPGDILLLTDFAPRNTGPGFDEFPQDQPLYTSQALEEDAMVVDSMLAASANPESDHDVQDNDSELPEGDDLRYDLENALGGDFEIEGSPAYGATAVDAPNPCLHVAGLGILGLPLSERDAKLLMNAFHLAPHGKCDEGKAVDLDDPARRTQEIDPAYIHVVNPAWDLFMSEMVKTVCKALGAVAGDSPPRYELSRVMIHQSGSQYSRQQEIEDMNETFARIRVLLPSCYTGGQVHVSHESSTQSFDFAHSSLLSMSVLGWYMGVIHEMKPITSGYRLALVYNLVLTANVPRPRLPNISAACAELHTVLRKWMLRKYLQDSDTNVITYILKRRYSKEMLTMATLEGQDRQKVSHLRSIAADLGYVVGFGNLEYLVTGHPAKDGSDEEEDDDEDDDDNEDDDDEEDEDQEEDHNDSGNMDLSRKAEVKKTSVSIHSLVDLDGVRIPDLDKLPLKEESLVPENPFAEMTPDNAEYDYTGRVQMDRRYCRRVLFLFHRDNMQDLLLAAGGVKYALKSLEDDDSRCGTEGNDRMIEYILQHANKTPWVLARQALVRVAYCASQWKNADMWRRAAEKAYADQDISVFGKDNLLEACRTLSFNVIRPVLEKILRNSPCFKTRIDLLTSLRGQSSDEKIVEWCRNQSSVVITSVRMASIDDVPALVSAVVLAGLSIVEDTILPKWGITPSTFGFWVSFIKELYKNKSSLDVTSPSRCTIPSSEIPLDGNTESDDMDDNLVQEEISFERTICKCFNAAIRQWDSVPRTQSISSGTRQQMKNTNPDEVVVSRVTELVDLCLVTDNMAACIRLILVLVRCKGDPEKRFEVLYFPLVHKLHEVLKKHNLEICSRPFCDLARTLIGMYLATVLGGKPPETKLQARSIGCGCIDCIALDKFMHKDVDIKFSCSSSRRTHLEDRVLRAIDLVTFLTSRTATTCVLVISKRAELVSQFQWRTRLAKAQKFLSSIGNSKTISMIMGPRYEDVEKALNGTQPYAMKLPPPTDITEQSDGPQAALSPSDTDSTSLKRKREGQDTSAAVSNHVTEYRPFPTLQQYFTPRAPKRKSSTVSTSLHRQDQNTTLAASRTGNQVHTQALPRNPLTASSSASATVDSPRTNTASSRNSHLQRQTSATQSRKVLNSSSVANTTKATGTSSASHLQVKVDHTNANSASKRHRKHQQKSYNFIGPVIDLTNEED